MFAVWMLKVSAIFTERFSLVYEPTHQVYLLWVEFSRRPSASPGVERLTAGTVRSGIRSHSNSAMSANTGHHKQRAASPAWSTQNIKAPIAPIHGRFDYFAIAMGEAGIRYSPK